MEFKLCEYIPTTPPGILSRYLLVDELQSQGATILIVSYEGIYPDGSQGKAHVTYISASAVSGIYHFEADCVILDFRRLTYNWGNNMAQVFADISRIKNHGRDLGDPDFPIVVVTSEISRQGVLSLITPSGESPPDWHCESIDAAIHYGIKQYRLWVDS